ncbi:MAG: T9SS type A sorting domain-containing protein [Bacteroidetes bacterium]|nr:T9SS type A sorting domain-containing protein [Bacteroidota bacterium]MCW5897154.1 T9SS type A sorting domain-containing protein [Bacteroidota bacterium]
MYPDSMLVDFDSTVGSCLPGPPPQGCVVGDYWSIWLGRYARIVTISRNYGYDFWAYADSMGFAVFHASRFQNYFPVYTIGARINGVEYGIILAVGESEQELPSYSFALHQNYPNPFNPTTTIRFEIPHASFVTLKVFDLLGREVKTLVDEVMQPGSYERVFNAEELASGVYLYRLRAGNFEQTKRTLILK